MARAHWLGWVGRATQAQYPNALNVATQLIEKLKGKQLAVFLDYDGTTARPLPMWLYTAAPQRAPVPSSPFNHPTVTIIRCSALPPSIALSDPASRPPSSPLPLLHMRSGDPTR